MAVKCARKIISNPYFCSPYIERKNSYSLRSSRSSLNLSKSSPPDRSSKLSKYTQKVKYECLVRKRGDSLRSSKMNVNSTHKKNSFNLNCMPEKEPPIRNFLKNTAFLGEKRNVSRRSLPVNASSEYLLNGNAKRPKSTPDRENEHPMRKKLRKLAHTATPNCTSQTQNMMINEDLHHSVLTRNQRKSLNDEHPMRTKLRKLAHTATPKCTSQTQNMMINEDLHHSVLTRNQRKSLNAVSSESIVSECILHAPRTVKLSKKSSIKVTSQTIEKLDKKSIVLKNDIEDSGILVSTSNCLQHPLKDLKVNIPVTDVLVCLPQNLQKVKGRPRKSTRNYVQETPVIIQSSRSLRCRNNSNKSTEESLKVALKTIQKSNRQNTVSIKNVDGDISGSKSNCLELPLNGLKVNMTSTDDIVCLPRKPKEYKEQKAEVVPKAQNSIQETPVVIQNYSRSFRRSPRNLDKLTQRPEMISKASSHSGVAGKRKSKDSKKTDSFSHIGTPISTRFKVKSNKREFKSEKAAAPLKRSQRLKRSLPIDLIFRDSKVNTKQPCDNDKEKINSLKVKGISIQKENVTVAGNVSTRSKRKSNEKEFKSEKAAPIKRIQGEKTSLRIDSICRNSEVNTKHFSCHDAEEKMGNSGKEKSITVSVESVTVAEKEKAGDKRNKINLSNENSKPIVIGRITRSTHRSSRCMRDKLLDSLAFAKKPIKYSLPNSNENNHKSQNCVKTHNEDLCSSVPIDILTTIPLDSLHESQDCTSKDELGNIKIIPKAALLTKNLDPAKPAVSDTSSERKKTKELTEKILGPKKGIPRKGTMKRKRWVMKTLREKSEGYEDDIFENRKNEFSTPPPMIFDDDDESDATDVSITTPICGFLLTPNIPKRTPQYKPCISTNELLAARKLAEEYIYRRNKTWKKAGINDFQSKTGVAKNSQASEEKKVEASEALANVLKAQEEYEKLTREESEEEDEYFSDGS